MPNRLSLPGACIPQQEFDRKLFQLVKVLTNVHWKNEAQALGILHRYNCNLIEQTEAHILVGLFLHEKKGSVGEPWAEMSMRTFSSFFSSSLASAAAGAAPPPEVGAAATAPPDGTCTRARSIRLPTSEPTATGEHVQKLTC